MECLRLRMKNVDFAYRQILVREGKGGKDRVTMFPESAVQPMHQQLGHAKKLHEFDLREGYGETSAEITQDICAGARRDF